MTRYEFNKSILEELEKEIEKEENKDIRFGQLLSNIGVVNDTRLFYEESEETYKVILRTLNNV